VNEGLSIIAFLELRAIFRQVSEDFEMRVFFKLGASLIGRIKKWN